MIEANQQEKDLRSIFAAAITAVEPSILVKNAMKLSNGLLTIEDATVNLNKKKIVLLGAGKAAVAMAAAAEEMVSDYFEDGFVVTKYGHRARVIRSEVLEAGHPVPDQNSVRAASKMISFLQNCDKHSLVLFLMSGGASSLLADLPGKFSLEELALTFNFLSAKGANIDELNTIRKHLSAIKGGQLLRCAPSTNFITLALSDVIGDDPGVIGSGPTVADQTTFAGALSIIEKYQLTNRLPASIIDYLELGKNGKIPETVKPTDKENQHTTNAIIGNNRMAREAAGAAAIKLGYEIIYIDQPFEGDAEQLSVRLTRQIEKMPSDKKFCLIAGGESTVNITGPGKGGRNQHLALAMAINLKGLDNFSVLVGGTDGSDGPTDVTGAIVNGQTCQVASQLGIDAESFLKANDAYHFFKKVGGHVTTGPTGTNVMDLIIAVHG